MHAILEILTTIPWGLMVLTHHSWGDEDTPSISHSQASQRIGYGNWSVKQAKYPLTHFLLF